MADTQRTLSAILTLLADNTSQAISAQDLRDAIVSVFANYGMMYVHEGTTSQDAVTTAETIEGFQTDGANGVYTGAVTPDQATSKLTFSVAGTYLVFLTAAMSSSAATEIHFHLDKNGGTHVSEGSSDVTVPATNKYINVTVIALLTVSAADYIVPKVAADSSTNLVLTSGSFGAVKVG